jgi:hypothetical protein
MGMVVRLGGWTDGLDGHANGPINVRPIRVETVFGASGSGGRLSDHDGYLVRYRLSWGPASMVASPQRPVEIRPQFPDAGDQGVLEVLTGP